MILIAEGYVAKQPALVVVSQSAVKLEFTVLEKRSSKEQGEWVQVTEAATFVAWNDDARFLAEQLSPGRELQAVGRQETSRWTDATQQKHSRVLYRLVDFTLRVKRQPSDTSGPEGAAQSDGQARRAPPRDSNRSQPAPRTAPVRESGTPRATAAAARPPLPDSSQTDDEGFYRF